MEPEEEEALNTVRAILGEHFHNFSFSVLLESGAPHYDYTNHYIGKMLFETALKDMSGGSFLTEEEITIDGWDEEEDGSEQY